MAYNRNQIPGQSVCVKCNKKYFAINLKCPHCFFSTIYPSTRKVEEKDIIMETNSKIRLHWDETEDIGIVTHYKGKPFTGICYASHKNGILSEEYEMINGLKHGVAKHYNEDARLLMEINFQDDKKNGLQKTFLENGQLSSEEIYVNNILESYTNYYENGTICTEQLFTSKGLLQILKSYKPNGERQPKILFLDPKEGGLVVNSRGPHIKTDYYPNGKIQSEVMMKDAKPNGIYKRFYLNGELEIEGNTINGKEEGEWKTYNQEGELLKTINYKNGVEISKKTPDNASNFVILASMNPEDLDWVVMDMSIRKVVFTSDSHEECKKWIAN